MDKIKLENNNDLLNILMADQKSQTDDLYKPGNYWLKYSRRIYEEIQKSGLENFRHNVNIGKGYADVINKNPFELVKNPWSLKEKIIRKIPNLPIVNRYVTNICLQWIESLFSQMLSFRSKYYSVLYGSVVKDFASRLKKIDYGIGNPTNVVNFDGHTIGLSYFKAMLRLSAFEKKINFNKCHVLFELGGGFGSTTDLIIRLYPSIKKIIYLDIPPNLYIGTQYLKSIYGKECIKDYLHTRHQTEIRFVEKSDQLEILAITPWQLSKLQAQVDIFYNTESFQEMPLKIIRNYSKYISKLMTKSKNVCLSFYEHTNVPDTIDPNVVKFEVSEQLGIDIKEFSPEFIVDDGSILMCGSTSETN
ncbi:putative sugar O-methyltransferase [Leptospira noguchii]|uniref:Sugar O-methyltransferase n=1 Tax=Leptospira noguchii TaxID=28182 RepID=A0AAE9K9G1_9LEPT|nr:putative sugar O-methyltransferase [Leptospira noguchii]UOG29267.1 putative sugar O-methyltransferase [Leptospira noguchii]UOG35387.1 putative sugar O-methyltransferase [Leptospira noguchii]UOG46305.1 putative sugar O-methyltransferase [Leptospira noguchii]UOG55412.1 putative sugar O-methyltransferase [Leptospira noguchii]